jgi:hypothetical protein
VIKQLDAAVGFGITNTFDFILISPESRFTRSTWSATQIKSKNFPSFVAVWQRADIGGEHIDAGIGVVGCS